VFQIGFPTPTNFPRFFLIAYKFFSCGIQFSCFIPESRKSTAWGPLVRGSVTRCHIPIGQRGQCLPPAVRGGINILGQQPCANPPPPSFSLGKRCAAPPSSPCQLPDPSPIYWACHHSLPVQSVAPLSKERRRCS
jgi:hypothetical protein